MLTIEAASYFVPPTRLKIEDSLERYSLKKVQAKVFSTFYGLDEVPYADDMQMVDLVKKPIEELLTKTEIPKEQIKYIIHAHTANVITRFGRSVIRDVAGLLGLDDVVVFGTSLIIVLRL